LLPITYLAVLATLVESLPLEDVDNITITLAAVALGYLLF
jgi:dolichol kinase